MDRPCVPQPIIRMTGLTGIPHSKSIRQSTLELLRDLLVQDRYIKASARTDDLGTASMSLMPTEEVFFERLVHSLAPTFFSSSPFDAAGPPVLRDGTSPLELHIQSGSHASLIRLPGIASALGAPPELSIGVPDVEVRAFGGRVAYFYVNDINLRPADFLGSVDVSWNHPTHSLMFEVEFETLGVEILGSVIIIGDVEIDLDKLTLRIFFKPRITRGRLLWDWGVMALAGETGGDGGTGTRASFDGFTDEIVRAFPADFSSESETVKKVAESVAAAVASMVEEVAELAGNFFLALPLRPRVTRAESLDEFLGRVQDALNERDIHWDLIGRPEDLKLLLGIVLGYFTDPTDHIALGSALGMQNLLNVVPFGHQFLLWSGLDPENEPLNRLVNCLSEYLREAWLRELGRTELSESEGRHLQEGMIPRELELLLREYIELAHVVDREAAYTEVVVNSGETECLFNFSPLHQRVRCMRYRVSLETFELVSDDPETFERELREWIDSAGARPGFGTRSFFVEWEVYSFHSVFGDRLDPAAWVRDSSGLFPGTQLLRKETQFIELTGLRNTTDLLSKVLYLEWSTPDSAVDAKLLIVGRVLPYDGMAGDEFRFVIPMTSNIGLFNAGSLLSDTGDVDEIVTFRSETVPGHLGNLPFNWRMTARLTQMPFARHYDWINVAVVNFKVHQHLFSEVDPSLRFEIEGKLNGVTFATYSQSSLSRLPSTAFSLGVPLDSRWSQDVIFDRSSIADFFELEVVLHTFKADGFEPALEPEPTIPHRFLRFSNEHDAEIPASGSVLERAIDAAVRDGARFNWGISMGLPQDEFQLQDREHNPRFEITIRMTGQNVEETPAEQAPRTLRVEYPKGVLTRATPGAGADEVRFFPFVDRKETIGGQERITPRIFEGSTRQFEMYEGDEVLFEPPIAGDVSCHPGEMPNQTVIAVQCRGVEYDWRRQRLGLARHEVDVTVGSSPDVSVSAESDGVEGAIRMHATITTTSPPPRPRLRFEGMPTGVDFRTAVEAERITLAYATSWSEGLFLMQKSEEDADYSLPPDGEGVLSALSGTVDVRPETTTFYKLRSVSGAMSSESQEIAVVILP